MPIYEYACDTCGARSDALIAIADRDVVRPCPDCGEESLRRLVSLPANRGSCGEGPSGPT
jgi:putative FmdB family regulatory protein